MLGLFKKKLPHCDDLLRKYFGPWYLEDDPLKIARPDIYVISEYEGRPLNPELLQYLSEEDLERNKKQIGVMENAALSDYQHFIKSGALDLNVLDTVDKHYGRKEIADLIKISDPTDFSNDYLISVCEFGVMLGHLFTQIDGYVWFYSHPYFFSIIVHLESGYGIPVFDWAIKKFSEYGVDDGFVDKFHMALEVVKEPK